MSEVKAAGGWWQTGSRSSNSTPGSARDKLCLRGALSFGWKAHPQSLSFIAPLSSARLRAKPRSCVPTVPGWKPDTRPCWHPPEVAGLESAPLSGWSRNAPTSQNTSAHRPGDLNELCGGGEGTMQGTGSEAKGKWPGRGAGNPGHVGT